MAKIEFFPVGNGDMTLITLDNGKKILVDCNIRAVSDDVPDVKKTLRQRLSRNSSKQLYIDVFLWTHPDEDHCRGIQDTFHMGEQDDWKKDDDKIVINEIWSSPIVFRRASVNHTLSKDAKALNKEAKRRVKVYRDNSFASIGDKVLILCEDENGKTDDISPIVVKMDSSFDRLGGYVNVRLLAPSPKSELDKDDDKLGKNHSSVIVNMALKDSNGNEVGRFLNGGDAEVVCWEHLWSRLNKKNKTSWLEYTVLQAPHHCSWHSLSHESWKDTEGKAKPSDDAYKALSNCRDKAYIVSSSKKITDDYIDPPCYGAKKQYLKMLKQDDCAGTFKCVADVKVKGENIPFEIELTSKGIEDISKTATFVASTSPQQVQKKNGRRYA